MPDDKNSRKVDGKDDRSRIHETHEGTDEGSHIHGTPEETDDDKHIHSTSLGTGDDCHDRVDHFQAEREELNHLVMIHGGTTVKRFFSLDSQVYREGALPARTKELLGLVASLVLRCDDCILYHIIRCREEGVTGEEFDEALGIGLVVGGSIAIPHMRRAYAAWDQMNKREERCE